MFGPVELEIPTYAWQQVAGQIIDAIADGTLPPGRRIPNEDDLAHSFQVARGTIRRSVKWLIKQGVLVAVRGRGTYIAAQRPRPLPTPAGREAKE